MKAAIVVGCGRYEDPAIADLAYASADAQAVADRLLAVCDVGPDNIFELSAGPSARGNPTRAALIRALAQGRKLSIATPLDTLFFMFSGHGCRHSADGREYLLLSDTVVDALEDTAVDYDTVVRYLRQWNARQIILLLDACRSQLESGKSLQVDGLTALDESRLLREGMATFCSCSPGQRSFEADGEGHGIFTASLLRAWSDEGRCATIFDLDQFLLRDVPALAMRRGLPIQNPITRIEPLDLQTLPLVSHATLLRWQGQLPLGREKRKASAVKSPISSDQENRTIIGMDFGTSSSAACILSPNQPTGTVMESAEGAYLIPSVIHFDDKLDYVVGRDAVKLAALEPQNAISFVKRQLASQQLVVAQGRTWRPEIVASLIIKSLKTSAEEALGSPVSNVIASYPVNFDTGQLASLIESFRLAGFSYVRPFSEATIAALAAYDAFFDGQTDILLLIVDLGGGTLDVAKVLVENDPNTGILAEVVGVGGDVNLGGNDYTEALADAIGAKAVEKCKPRQFSCSRAQLLSEAERVKIMLREHDSAQVYLGTVDEDSEQPIDVSIAISRSEAAELFRPLNTRAVALVEEVLNKTSHYTEHRLPNAIVLAGMGTKVIDLAENIACIDPKIPVISKLQESAVIKGLARYLPTLLRGDLDSPLLLDVAHANYLLRCASISSMRRMRHSIPQTCAVLELGETEDENSELYCLLDCDATVPTLQEVRCRLADGVAAGLLTILEQSGSGEISRVVAELRTVPPSPGGDFAIFLDIDTAREVAISIGFEDGQIESFVITHLGTVDPQPEVAHQGKEARVQPINKLRRVEPSDLKFRQLPEVLSPPLP